MNRARIRRLVLELLELVEEDEEHEPKRKQQPRRKRKLRAEDYELARKVMGGVKEEG